MEPKNTANREGFQKFLDFCNNALIEDSKPLEIMKLIRKRYKECVEEFLESEEFYELLVTSHAKILGDRGKFFVYLKQFLNTLKQNRRTISKSDNGIKRCLDTDNSSDSDSDQQSKRPRLSGYYRGGSCSDDNDWSRPVSNSKSVGSGSEFPESHVSSRQQKDLEFVTNPEYESQDNKDLGFESNQDIDKDCVKQQTLSDYKDNEENTGNHNSDSHNDNVGEQCNKESDSEINQDIGKQSEEILFEENEAFENEAVLSEKQSNIDEEQEQVEEETVDIQGSTLSDSDIIFDSGQLGNSGQFHEAQTMFKPQKGQELTSASTRNAGANLNSSVQILEEEFDQAILTISDERDESTDTVDPSKNTDKKSIESSDNELIKKEKFLPQIDTDHGEQNSEAEITLKSGNKDKFTSWISQARSRLKTMKDETDSSSEDRGMTNFHRTHTGKRKYSSSGSSDEDNLYRKETKQKREKRQKKYKISVGKGTKKDKDEYSQSDHKSKKTSPKDKLSPKKKKDIQNSPKKSPSLSLHKSPILIVTDSESEEEKPRSLTPLDEEFCAEKRQLFGIKKELKVEVEKIKTESVVIKDEIPLEDCSELKGKGDTDSEQLTKECDNISDIKAQDNRSAESDQEGVKIKSDNESNTNGHDKDDKTESIHAKKRVAIVTEVLFEKTKVEETKLEAMTSDRVENSERNLDSDNEDLITEVDETKSMFPTEQKYPPKRSLEKESSDLDERDTKDNDDDVKDVSESRKEEDDVQPGTSGESSNPKIVKGSVKQVKRLEKLLEQIRDKIENVRKRELDFDDLNSNVSDYILEDRLQQKFVKVWKKLCELHNSATSTGRPTEKYFKYQGTRYPDVNRKIEKFVNKKKVFPDYHDVRNIIMKVNKDKKLHLRPKMIDDLAREAFTDVGNKLQRRRKKDFRENIDTRDINLYSVYDDPALYDTDLKKKLEANKRAAKSSIEKVVDKYARLQYEEGDPEEDDGENDNDEDNEDEAENDEEEEEEEEDLIESAGNQPTKEIDQDVILLLEEDEEKLDSDEEGRTKQKIEVDPKLTVPITKVKQEPKKVHQENPQTFSDGKSQYFGEMFGLQNTKPKPREQIKTVVKETAEGISNKEKEPVKTQQGSIPMVKKDVDKHSGVADATKAPVKAHQGALPAIKTGVQKSALDTAAVCKQVTDILTKEFSQGVIEINSDEEENAQPKPADKLSTGCSIVKEPALNTAESKNTAKETKINIESDKGDVERNKKKEDDLIVIDLDEDDVQIIDENSGAISEYNADEYYDYADDNNQYYDQSHYDNQYYDINQCYQTDLYKVDYKKEKEKNKKPTKRTSGWHYETPALNLQITSPRHISVNDHLTNTNKHKSHYNGLKEKVNNSTFEKGNPEKVKAGALQNIPITKVVEKIDLTSSDCIEIDPDDNEDKSNSQVNQNNDNGVTVCSVDNSSNSKEILICDSPKDSLDLSPSLEDTQNVDVSENTGRDSVTIIDQDDDVKEAEIDHSDDNDSSVKLIEETGTSKEGNTCEAVVDSSIDVVSIISDKTESGTIIEEKLLESVDKDEEQHDIDEGEESELEEGEIIYPEEDSADDDDSDESDQTNEKMLKSSVVENQKHIDDIGEESNASSDKFVAIPLKLYDDSEQVHDTADELGKEFEENDGVEYDDEKLDDFGDLVESVESDLEFDQSNLETTNRKVDTENTSKHENRRNISAGSQSGAISEQHSFLNEKTNTYCSETLKELKDSTCIESCLSKVNMEDISVKYDGASYESNPDIFYDDETVDSLKKTDERNCSVINAFNGKENVKLNSSKEDIAMDVENSNDSFDDGRDCEDDEMCLNSHENTSGEKLVIPDDKNEICSKKGAQYVDQVTYYNDDDDSSSQCSDSLLSGAPGITDFKSSKYSPHETKIDKGTDISKYLENDVERCENILSSSPKDSSNDALEIIENQGAQVIHFKDKKIKFHNEHESLIVGDNTSVSNDKHDSINENDIEDFDYSDCEDVNSETNDSVQKAILILDDKSDNIQGEVTSESVISSSVQDKETGTRTSVGHSSVIKLKQPEVRNKLLKLKNAIQKIPNEANKKNNKEAVNSEAKPASSLLQVEDKHLELIEGYEEPESYISKKRDKLVSFLVEEFVELSDSE